MAELKVEVVAVERAIWSGEAREVVARTTVGELGILPHHIPLLGQLSDGGVVEIYPDSGDPMRIAAHGGFLSVDEEKVSILAENAELGEEIDVDRARAAYERASGAGPDDDDARAAALRARSRLIAAGQTV